jgi:hypothetical protein
MPRMAAETPEWRSKIVEVSKVFDATKVFVYKTTQGNWSYCLSTPTQRGFIEPIRASLQKK